MTSRTKILNLLFVGVVICIGIALILYGSSNAITFFYKPSEIDRKAIGHKSIRVGGFVKNGSIEYFTINEMSFVLTDYKSEIKVNYKGVVPKLFRQGQGVVVKGSMQKDVFIATEVLAKHDENYTPPGMQKL